VQGLECGARARGRSRDRFPIGDHQDVGGIVKFPEVLQCLARVAHGAGMCRHPRSWGDWGKRRSHFLLFLHRAGTVSGNTHSEHWPKALMLAALCRSALTRAYVESSEPTDVEWQT